MPTPVLLFCTLILTGCLTAFAADTPQKRNVLFLVADDLNCDIAAFGHPRVQTPNIDALAKRGVLFERAYCQYPLCSPSRSSFLTGRRPNQTGIHTNPGAKNNVAPHFREHIPQTVTLPELFKKNGYFAARVGKLYHYGVPNDIGTSSLDDPQSWDQVVNPRGVDRESHSRIFSLTPGQFGGTVSWLATEESDAQHTDGIGATEAVKFLERFAKESTPFFLAVGFYRPHTPYVAPKKYFDLYPSDSIALPTLSSDDIARRPPAAYSSSKRDQDRMSDDQRRQATQAYWASISFMDAQVGRVVEALDRLGLASTTTIIFTSDHGYHVADHGLWQKRSLFERSARVPLIIAAPGVAGSGSKTRALVEMVDLYPTAAGLSGLQAPPYLDGTSLVPVLLDPAVSVKKAAFTQVTNANQVGGYAVRTDRWRYAEWDGGAAGSILFDMEKDPGETTNLSADPSFGEVVSEHKN
jgi:arylsulfatase A-like enzyme